MDSRHLIGPILRDVSRSFYLTLRVLPGPLREPVSLAYLLARATDTVADTRLLPRERRREHLARLLASIQGNQSCRDALPGLVLELGDQAGNPAEQLLLRRLPQCLELLDRQDEFDRLQIRQVLGVICAGQDADLARFGEDVSELAALETAEELDLYTYQVAGCVGEFWTRMCHRHLSACQDGGVPELLASGIRFGKALQLTNILRDMPQDLKNGRCYLPRAELEEAGLRPHDLLDPTAMPRLRPVYRRWLDHAERCFEDAEAYTLAYGRRHWQMRLACALPVLIGRRTLALLRNPGLNPLDSAHRIKVGRSEVRSFLVGAVFRLPANRLLAPYLRAAGQQGKI